MGFGEPFAFSTTTASAWALRQRLFGAVECVAAFGTHLFRLSCTVGYAINLELSGPHKANVTGQRSHLRLPAGWGSEVVYAMLILTQLRKALLSPKMAFGKTT